MGFVSVANCQFSTHIPLPCTQSQYKFIYDAVVEYLVSFDNYSNFK